MFHQRGALQAALEAEAKAAVAFFEACSAEETEAAEEEMRGIVAVLEALLLDGGGGGGSLAGVSDLVRRLSDSAAMSEHSLMGAGLSKVKR